MGFVDNQVQKLDFAKVQNNATVVPVLAGLAFSGAVALPVQPEIEVSVVTTLNFLAKRKFPSAQIGKLLYSFVVINAGFLSKSEIYFLDIQRLE